MGTIGAIAVRVLMAGLLIGVGSTASGCSSGGEGGEGSGAGTVATASGETTVASVPTSVGEADRDPGGTPIDRAAARADRVVAGFRDEPTAIAAVLLARDKGYSVVQIVAAADGRLQADGAVLDEGGGIADPDGAPTGLLIDDVTDDTQQAGFRAREVRVPVSTFVEATEDYADQQGYGGLTLIFLAFETGYSLDQIVLQVLADGQSGFRETGPNDDYRLYFYDESDSVIIPQSLSPEETPTETSAPAVPTSTEAPSAEETDGSDVTFAQLLNKAQGVYMVGPELESDLWSWGESVSAVNVATGELVVEADGTVSGELSFSVTVTVELTDGTVSNVYGIDYTLSEAELELLDDGLTFESLATMAASEDAVVYGTWDIEVTGLIDPDIGQLVVSGLVVTDFVDSVGFQRAED